jgi:hypothetical protein
METLTIVTAKDLFPKRHSKILKQEEELLVMKEISKISCEIYKYLTENSIVIKNINDEFPDAETFDLYDAWINEDDMGTLSYVDCEELLDFLNNLQKSTDNVIIGYRFHQKVTVKMKPRNLAEEIGMTMYSNNIEKPFNMIASIVVASPRLKRMWYHVIWNLSKQQLKKQGWKKQTKLV